MSKYGLSYRVRYSGGGEAGFGTPEAAISEAVSVAGHGRVGFGVSGDYYSPTFDNVADAVGLLRHLNSVNPEPDKVTLTPAARSIERRLARAERQLSIAQAALTNIQYGKSADPALTATEALGDMFSA